MNNHPGMTVSDVIDAMGGYKAVAALFGVGPSAVCNWKAANRFPDRLHYRVMLECRRRRIKITDEILNGQPTRAA